MFHEKGTTKKDIGRVYEKDDTFNSNPGIHASIPGLSGAFESDK
jgi:hypothetical protein